MGKNLIQQKRGKGSPTYRAPSHRYKGKVIHFRTEQTIKGVIEDIIHCPGHSGPLAKISFEGKKSLIIAPAGIKVGDIVYAGEQAPIGNGNTTTLKNIPEGTLIYNIESSPGDGGKFVRAGGGFARVITKMHNNVIVQLPSKKQKSFNQACMATIGVIAGSGRREKPFVKAGTKYYKMKARNKLWPTTSGVAMNAVDHPFGGTRSSRKGRPLIAPRFAPPGRKVGALRPKRTGRKKK